MTKDIENPETIEIHGLKTIHKLCKFGADNNMEGCTFTEIVERMFLELKKLDGCVVVPESEYKEIAQYKDLYKRAIVNARKRKNQINWAHVAGLGVGSGRAVELCKELKIDPHATDMNAMLEAARGGK